MYRCRKHVYVPSKKLRKISACSCPVGLDIQHSRSRLILVKQLVKIMQRIDVKAGDQRMMVAADYALTVEDVLYRVRLWRTAPDTAARVSFYTNGMITASPIDSHAWYLTPSVNGLPFYTMPYAAWDALLEM